MVHTTLSNSRPNFLTSNKGLNLTSFLQHAPTGYAIFDLQKKEFKYFNEASLQVLQCDALALNTNFPNATSLRIQEPQLARNWQSQLDQLHRKGSIDFEWSIQSRYGIRRTIKIGLWKIEEANENLAGVRLEDVTKQRKLTQESSRFVKII